MKCPILWAKRATDNLGPERALEVASNYARPLIGTDQSEKNPHSRFYQRAVDWIQKHASKGA